jgi:hypothetical protein
MSQDSEQARNLAHFAALGLVAANWATLEYQMQKAIWALANLDEHQGACITIQIGNSARLMNALLSLLACKGAEEKALTRLRKFAEKLHSKQEKRNRIIHDQWFLRNDGRGGLKPMRYTVTARKKLSIGFVDEPQDNLLKFAHEIEELCNTFYQLLDDLEVPVT